MLSLTQSLIGIAAEGVGENIHLGSVHSCERSPVQHKLSTALLGSARGGLLKKKKKKKKKCNYIWPHVATEMLLVVDCTVFTNSIDVRTGRPFRGLNENGGVKNSETTNKQEFIAELPQREKKKKYIAARIGNSKDTTFGEQSWIPPS